MIPRLTQLVSVAILFVALTAPTVSAKFIDNLSYDDLSSTLRNGPTMLVFTVSWCPHCKEVLPEIGVLAKAVKKNDGITVARVDGDAEPAILSKFSVESFPAFLYFPPAFDLRQKDAQPEEFTDYRWAELMAEFVNNETKAETVKLKAREKFLKWRKKVPYNKGKQPRQVRITPETPTPHPEGLDPILGADEDGVKIRDPVLLDLETFDGLAMNEKEGVAVYFYTKDDFEQRSFLIEWRQASSAYTPEDHVTLAMINIENGDNEQVAKRFEVEDTPAIAYFRRCDVNRKNMTLEECKKPVFCESCTDTEKILDFVSTQMMAESGYSPTGEGGSDDVVTLTTEEYDRLVKEGKIIPLKRGADGSEVPETEAEGVETEHDLSPEEYDQLMKEGKIARDSIDEEGVTVEEAGDNGKWETEQEKQEL